MTIHLEELVVKALHTKMIERLPSWIDTVNAEFVTPEYELDGIDVDTQVLDFMPTISHIVNFPTFAIAEGEITYEDDVGWSATARIPLSVVLYDQHFDSRALTWRLRRYMTALANCVLEGRDLGEGWGVVLKGMTPGPRLRVRESPSEETSGRSSIIGMRALTIEVRDEQDA